MHIEILVEEPSMEEALSNILPRILPEGIGYAIHPFQGKQDLLKKLPSRLRGYQWIPDDYRIIVLVDRDQDDCLMLKAIMEKSAIDAGFSTKSSSGAKHFQVLNRVVVEELEAWFLGDIQAVQEAYPRVLTTSVNSRKLHDPDAIVGGTWETLERILKRAGYHRTGLRKIEAARDISAHMVPERNRSRSFQVFCEGLRQI